jgi:hypothetical protein
VTLNQYQIECARNFFEGTLRHLIEQDRANLTTEANEALGRLIQRRGIRHACRDIRVELEETRCRDLSVAIMGIDRKATAR